MRRKNLAPKIGTSKGYLYIQIPRGLTGGKQKRIWGFGCDTAENQLEAKSALSVIQRDIDYNEFDTTLQKYTPAAKTESSAETNTASSPEVKQPTIEELLSAFEKKYFLTRKRTRKSEKTHEQHRSNILRGFKILDGLNQPLTKEALDKAIESTDAGSSMRRQVVKALSVFCRTLKIEYDFTDLANGYEPARRDLPTDEEIEKAWDAVGSEGKFYNKRFIGSGECWGWMFAVIATYGLRCHELLAIDYKKSFKPPHYPLYIDGHEIGGTKTGPRIVFPIPPEWVEKFDIVNPKLMFLEERKEFFHKNPRGLANNFGERLRLKKTGFPAYHMRHRYAVRGHELGFPIDDMARWMGHTVTEHTKTYQKYLGEETHFIAYEAGIRKAVELKKIKDGCPSYSELELQLEMAKAKIAKLETELTLMKVISG